MKKCFTGAAGFLLLLFLGCKDQPEAIPAYLEIKPFVVNAEGGAAWQKITEGYVYVNREYLGAYTLPAIVPVLAEGESLIWVYPGVKKSGISATPDIYPFLLRSEHTLPLTGGQTTVVQPLTSYDPDSKFAWTFDRTTFDGGSSVVFKNRDSDDGLNFQISADDAIIGKSLLMQVDTAHPLMQIVSEAVTLPTDRSQVWVEMQYKNDLVLDVFLLGSNSDGSGETGQELIYLNPRASWNKVYINLTETLLDSKKESYRLYFQLRLPKDSAGKYTQTSGKVYIDNLRLINF